MKLKIVLKKNDNSSVVLHVEQEDIEDETLVSYKGIIYRYHGFDHLDRSYVFIETKVAGIND